LKKSFLASVLANSGLAAAVMLFCIISGASAAPLPKSPLSTYDLTPTLAYDLHTERGKNNAWAEVHLAAALQGLVNRQKPRLYVTYVTDDGAKPGRIDRFWLAQLREPGAWLAGRPLHPIPTLESLIAAFRTSFKGVVLYDLRIPATSNVASTVAGCEELLPVPFDPAPGSVYDRLVVHGPKLPVKLRLLHTNGSPLFTGIETGSAKCDAYLWAKRRYLDTGRCTPALFDYALDSWWLTAPTKAPPNCHGLSNHDYFVARKAFFFDLSPWDDELPQDDLKQPLGMDTRTLNVLLRSAYDQTHGKQMIHVGGFVPWAWKYTQTAGGHHGDVATEWRYASILSCYNAYMDADALGLNAMANASVFALFPKKPRYPQPKPTATDWAKAGYLDTAGDVVPETYVSFYVGDYDSAAWLYQKLPNLWNDPVRGSVPLGWAFNPNLVDRFPVGLDWVRRTASLNDHFITGDSGAGYLNPGYLDGDRPFSHLPPGLTVWDRHCQQYYSQWDLSLTGFVIDGDARPMSADALAAYARFSLDGFIAQKLPSYQGLVSGTQTPFLTMGSDMPNPDQIDEAVSRIQAQLTNDHGPGPHFHIFRTVLWLPSDHQRLFTRLQDLPHIRIVDPYTLMGLLRRHLSVP
jgi:hypothetical protein